MADTQLAHNTMKRLTLTLALTKYGVLPPDYSEVVWVRPQTYQAFVTRTGVDGDAFALADTNYVTCPPNVWTEIRWHGSKRILFATSNAGAIVELDPSPPQRE